MKETQLKNLVKDLNDFVQGNEERLEEVLQEAHRVWTAEQNLKVNAKQALQDLWSSQKRKRK